MNRDATQTPAPGGRGSLELMRLFLGLYPWRSLVTVGCLLLSGAAEALGLGAILPLAGLLMRREIPIDLPVARWACRAIDLLGLPASVPGLLAVIVTAFLVKALISFLTARYVAHTAVDIAADFRLDLLRALMKARWGFFLGQPSGRLAHTMGFATEQAAAIYLYTGRILAGVVQALTYAALAFAVSWRVTLLALAAGAAAMSVFHGFVKQVRRAGARSSALFESVNATLVDSLQGLKPLKAMACEDRVADLLEADIRDLKRWQRKTETSRAALRTLREPLQLAAAAAVFFLAWSLWNVGVEVLSLCLLLLVQVMGRINTLQVMLQDLVRYETMFWRLRDTIAQAAAGAEAPPAGQAPVLARGLQLDRISFRRGETPVLRDISAELPAGRITALAGPSGSGKTTLADLLVGLITPDAGEVRLDGVPLGRLDLRRWRERVGYVPQEPFLFHDTVRRNVTLGDPALAADDVERALRAVAAWDFIAALPKELDTVVGERGAKLSGGERQRIAIARALVRRPALLILDEATTGIDPATEDAILAALKQLPDHPTILAISHRSGFSRVADAAYTLEDGRLTPGARAG
ncbi:MAG TPA: ABC transporter ATP-binding protein [Kiritimatiellia bacterium]|nr:ABC transporter ATP-binding protein [Kiritimatiellia bacterium]HRZ13831.1 ABC transporter ATP-binding protein [Kiritimatiellia bacterium]HSA19452.1 ABC transporter ATP-binding protein [Kiritimatiellia bacterium]